MYIPLWIIILIFVVGFIFFRYLSHRVKKLEIYSGFEPRKLIIFPHWHQLLIDYHVIEKDKFEEIQKKCEEDNKFSEGKYHVLNNGINFSVLKWDEHSSLIYDNSRKQFLSNAFIREEIKEIELYKPV